MGAIRYSSPIWLVPTYILPAKRKQDFWESFSPIALKELVCAETEGHG